MGLPGSGKTTFAKKVVDEVMLRGHTCEWLNADDVRKDFQDWDFSKEGRERQAKRMDMLAKQSGKDIAVIDMICPTNITRELLDPNSIVWINTLSESWYEDTNKMFEEPKMKEVDAYFDHYPTEEDAKKVVDIISVLL
jgi:adenylylsulfate kinase